MQFEFRVDKLISVKSISDFGYVVGVSFRGKLTSGFFFCFLNLSTHENEIILLSDESVEEMALVVLGTFCLCLA